MGKNYTTTINKRLRKLSIRKRLNYSIVFLVIAPIVMIIVATHVIFGNAMKRNLVNYSEELTAQLGSNMETEVNWLVDNCIEIAYSDEFQRMVQNQSKINWDFLNNYRLVSNSSTVKFENTKYVEMIEYITTEGSRYHLYGTNYSDKSNWLQEILTNTEDITTPYFWYFYQNESLENNLYLITRIRKLSEGNVTGTMVVGVNTYFLQDLYYNMEQSLGDGTLIFTLDKSGNLISGTKEEFKNIAQDEVLTAVSAKKAGSEDFDIGGEGYLGIWNKMETSGWYVLSLIPYDYINSALNSTSILIIFIGIVVLLMGLSISKMINSSIVSPLNRILDHTVLLRKGHFINKIFDQGEDEIHELAEAFNCTTDEINRLMVDIKHQSEQKAKLEFDALQAQINPHFMANTLNTISYLAKLRGMDNIESISRALTNILVVSMGKESKIITIEKEISYVKDYLLIQSYRFSDFYQVDFDIPQELMKYRIPKFILQPVVENAVVHGVSQLEGKEGLVNIKGQLENQEIRISVTDNGPGIPEKKISRLLETEEESHGICGIGIKNVNQRLKLLFGEEYGVNIFSVPGRTTVEIKFPADGGMKDENSIDY